MGYAWGKSTRLKTDVAISLLGRIAASWADGSPCCTEFGLVPCYGFWVTRGPTRQAIVLVCQWPAIAGFFESTCAIDLLGWPSYHMAICDPGVSHS